MRVLVIGSKGQVACALRQAAPRFDCVVETRGRPMTDLLRRETILAAIAAVRPHVVINAAAYTAVEQAEQDVGAAQAANVEGAGYVAAAAAEAGIPLLHLSTDYVFDGKKGAPYFESDLASPQSVYAATKYAGEIEVARRHPQHVIVRTSWVFAPAGNSFVGTMLRMAGSQRTIRVVDDQIGCPSAAEDVANGLLAVARRIADPAQRRAWGIFHMAGAGETSRYGFARAIFAGARKLGGPDAAVEAVRTAELPSKARRPPDSRLDCAKLEREYGVRLPHWSEGLERCLSAMSANSWRLA